jgi:hypothetical protein
MKIRSFMKILKNFWNFSGISGIKIKEKCGFWKNMKSFTNFQEFQEFWHRVNRKQIPRFSFCFYSSLLFLKTMFRIKGGEDSCSLYFTNSAQINSSRFICILKNEPCIYLLSLIYPHPSDIFLFLPIVAVNVGFMMGLVL